MRAAINTYNDEILVRLLRFGSNMRDKDASGRTALTYARWNWKIAKSEIVKYMQNKLEPKKK